jgi:REP element-mobilizing transposase RayT
MGEMHVFHGKDLRKGRHSELGRPYLITAVTRARETYFRDFTLARMVVAELRDATERGMAESLAWVIMPDHLHWLLVPRSSSLQIVIQRVKSRSAIAINRKLGGYGPVWQKGYHDHALRREENLLRTARYIVANPLRSGLVRHLSDYPHWDAAWL